MPSSSASLSSDAFLTHAHPPVPSDLFLLSFLLGGIVFKVYIVGESITVVRRFSLPNHGKRDLSKVAGMYPVPRISSYLSSAEDADLDPSIAGEIVVFSFLFPK